MLIFVSYASPDRERITPFVDALNRRGFDIWIDFRNLKGGQDWRFEIERVIDRADIVLAFISQNSVVRRGFVQRELLRVLDKSTEKLREDIYLIPVLLDEDVEVPPQIQHLHHISARRSDALDVIADALHHQSNRLGEIRRDVQEKGGVWWESRTVKESWDGYPGFSVELQYLEFRSDRYPQVEQITEYIKGRFLFKLLDERGLKINQMPDLFGNEDNAFRRTNTYDADCQEPNLIGRILSLQYRIHRYGAGAAHPNMHFETFNFFLDPVAIIRDFLGMFRDVGHAHKLIQQEVRRRLYEVRLPWDEGEVALERKWVDEGTESPRVWDSSWFTGEGVEFLFAPYAVGPYAAGAHVVLVPYEVLLPHMRAEIVSALELSSES